MEIYIEICKGNRQTYTTTFAEIYRNIGNYTKKIKEIYAELCEDI